MYLLGYYNASLQCQIQWIAISISNNIANELLIIAYKLQEIL